MIQIKAGETTAARRRVPLKLTTDGVAPWDGVVTGIKAGLSKNGAAEAPSTADIVKLAAGNVYVELTAAELSDVGFMIVTIAADTGRAMAHTVIQVVSGDPAAGNFTLGEVANAVNPPRSTPSNA